MKTDEEVILELIEIDAGLTALGGDLATYFDLCQRLHANGQRYEQGTACLILKDLPADGVLFPYLSTVRAGDRATEFGQRRRQLGIKGVTLHSYRYAWAQCSLVCTPNFQSFRPTVADSRHKVSCLGNQDASWVKWRSANCQKRPDTVRGGLLLIEIMDTKTDDTFPITKTITIKEAGHNETWLQDQICANPSILPFGEALEFLTREKILWKNGRLDILLKDGEDTMYEVEVMLGKSDEKHIIHTIEYWDNEKRKYQQRNHVAVLVAESFDTRFFNIMYLFSKYIPLIAVQVNMVEVSGVKSLHFTKILDIYQEPEDEDNATEVPEEDWKKDAPWTVEVAKTIQRLMNTVIPNTTTRYKQRRITFEVAGRVRIVIFKKAEPSSRIMLKLSETLLPKASKILSNANIDSDTDKWNQIRFPLNPTSITTNDLTIMELLRLLKSSVDESL